MVTICILTAGDKSMVVTDIDAVSQIILKGLSIFRFVGVVWLKAMHAWYLLQAVQLRYTANSSKIREWKEIESKYRLLKWSVIWPLKA